MISICERLYYQAYGFRKDYQHRIRNGTLEENKQATRLQNFLGVSGVPVKLRKRIREMRG